MVDGGGLENHCTGNRTGGSNPSPSATHKTQSWPADICGLIQHLPHDQFPHTGLGFGSPDRFITCERPPPRTTNRGPDRSRFVGGQFVPSSAASTTRKCSTPRPISPTRGSKSSALRRIAEQPEVIAEAANSRSEGEDEHQGCRQGSERSCARLHRILPDGFGVKARVEADRNNRDTLPRGTVTQGSVLYQPERLFNCTLPA